MRCKAWKISSGAGAVLVAAALMTLSPARAGARQAIPEAQQTAPGTPGTPGASGTSGRGRLPSDVLQDDPIVPNSARLEHMREDDRRKRLLADTAKLVELSTELKTDVENTSKDELSVDVVRKAAEIEKLAHDVKERMKS